METEIKKDVIDTVIEEIENSDAVVVEVLEDAKFPWKKVGVAGLVIGTAVAAAVKLAPKAYTKVKTWRSERKEAKEILNEVKEGKYDHYEREDSEEDNSEE